ncbi:MAG: hypothetical protein ACYDAL_14240 [Candidatus Dormibacteraceae bacterium]
MPPPHLFPSGGLHELTRPPLAAVRIGCPGLSSPTPSPEPIDSTTLGQEQLAYFEQLGTSIKLAIEHALIVTLHVLLIAAELALAASIAVLAVHLAKPCLQRAISRRPLAGLIVAPPADARFQPEAWVACFRALYSIARPWWKCWLAGQPWMVFEFRAQVGRVSAACWFPADLMHTVSNALAAAVPGVELRPHEETDLPYAPAARGRLRLWRESLYPLGTPRIDALASAVAALADSDDALLQVSIAPDTGWERRAERRLDQLSGDGPSTPLAIRILLKLIGLPFELFFELFWHSSTTSSYQPRAAPRSKPLRPRLPDAKAY